MRLRKSKWRLIWTAWLLTIVVSFAVLEVSAWENGITLSRYMADLGAAWPMVLVLYGMLAGGLAVHFWWRWGGK